MKEIRVLLADDHALVRCGIRSLLEKIPELQIVAEASDGPEALRLIEQHQPDVALIESTISKLNGLEVTARVSKECPNRPGRITRHGSKVLRSLLVEASWVGLRYNPYLRAIYEQVKRGSKTRRKIAIVAVTRRLLIWCWAMLRDGTTWQPPYPLEPFSPART